MLNFTTKDFGDIEVDLEKKEAYFKKWDLCADLVNCEAQWKWEFTNPFNLSTYYLTEYFDYRTRKRDYTLSQLQEVQIGRVYVEN